MIVLDTHALIWWINDPKQLSEIAKRAVNQAYKKNEVMISAMSLWEIAMLVKKERLQLEMDVEVWIKKIISLPAITVVDVNVEIAVDSVLLNSNLKDPADRIIITTAINAGVALVSADEKIRKTKSVRTIW